MEHSSHPPARLWWRVTSGVESDCHATPAWPGLLFYSSTDGWWISRLPLYSDCRLLFFFGTYSMTRCAVYWGRHSISHLLLITKEIIRNGDHGNWPAAYRLAGNALIYSVSKPQRAMTLYVWEGENDLAPECWVNERERWLEVNLKRVQPPELGLLVMTFGFTHLPCFHYHTMSICKWNT